MRKISRIVANTYEFIRDKHIKALEERQQEVYTKIPRIVIIEDALRDYGIELSKLVLTNPEQIESATQSIQKQVNLLKQEKAILLAENNLPISYLDMAYECDICHDSGFNKKGKRCTCFKQKMINHAYDMSNVSHILSKENFTTFNIDLYSDDPVEGQEVSPRENMKQVLFKAEGFVHNFNLESQENLLFFGPTGLGKTFLCNCIAKALLDKEKLVVYQTSFKILEILENYKFKNKANPVVEDSYRMLFDCDLLIIDDLGTEMTNSFTNTELFNIINTRMLNQKKVVISTNLSLQEFFETYGDSVGSRILGTYDSLEFYGQDIRWL